MGYTHYYRQYRALTEDEWRTFTDDVRNIFEATDVPLAGWAGGTEGDDIAVTDKHVSFNGVGRDACETCYIQRELRDLYDYERSRDGGRFEFCKTRQRPYDSVVVEVYKAAKRAAPDAFELSSDGDVF